MYTFYSQTFFSQSVEEGMLLLGRVKEVHEYELIVSLPNGLSGTVPITCISDAYSALLQHLANGDTSTQGVSCSYFVTCFDYLSC